MPKDKLKGILTMFHKFFYMGKKTFCTFFVKMKGQIFLTDRVVKIPEELEIKIYF